MAPNDGSSRSRRGVWSHWVPLAVTLTVATVGVAAWVWSQRKEEDEVEEHEPGLDYENGDYGDNPAYGSSRDPRPPPTQYPPGSETQQQYGQTLQVDQSGPNDATASGWGARMSGALRRTPSPQQFFDSTGKTVVAGVAAAGAAMGKALASIREEDKAYGGANPWSEEADAKRERTPLVPGGKTRKTVALVVSADSDISDAANDDYHEHASILSHIPRHNDFSRIKLFVLVFAPNLKEAPTDTTSSNIPPPSLSSSFSNIGHDQAQTPGDERKNPLSSSSSAAFNAVYSQALSIIDKETMILPFTTPNGHVHILRHLQPDVVYLQESLAGEDGGIVKTIQTWLRHDIILVVGAEGGAGGLVDSESEAERDGKEQKWWQRPERVGRGRGVVVVDSNRVHDDWSRRVQGNE